MKYIIHIVIACLICSCSSIPLPDLGEKKMGGKTYIAKQRTFFTKPVGEPVWEETETRADETRDILQKPAIWLLWGVLPGAILCGAAMVFMSSNPAVMKWLGTAAGTCAVAAVLCASWILATMWLLLLIPIVAIILIILYKKTKHKKLRMAGHDSQ